ncbi:Fe-S cluster assembly protein SufD [Enterococcus villorum]|uniref:Fe-S cluster assembly protein SufD n=1 Tax=Enterococcus villorum TaxID=112904 RepID=A0A1V8YQS2_9ENTE|nr:Fe-S cluster assembly protein SufD [Enterococcus villorum]OQO71185.1 Fe-S cluster assembly protein SufD [Enterococcus villorum]OQO74985.1 Fe-S cluster assembly protein SufD [Enterococcus villorum]
MKENNWLDQLDAVTNFSLSKGEPEWMTHLRQSALEKAGQLPLPQIDRVKFHRWPLFEVHEMSEHVSETGNVASFDQMKDNPVLVQEGTSTVFEQLPMDLVEKGVIFTDLFTALQEHPDLVKEYYMQKAVKVEEDQLTALHAAFMNSGMFLYVPKNVVIEEPIETLFIQAGDFAQHFFKHVLIVADEHSEFPYLERFQTTKEKIQKASGNIIVEVIAKAGAKVKYSAVDQLGENVTSYINRRGHILRDASVDWAIGVMNDGNVIADFDSDLVGEGAHAQVKIVAISSGKQIQGIDTRVTNKAPHSIGHILQHGVIREKGTLTFNGIGHILKGAKGADAQQESRVLMLSDKARGDANPILLIDENEVTAGHAASVGRVDPEEMYYLMSRGLHKEEAERLVIRGFLGSVLTAIPVEEVRKELVAVIEGKLNV